MTETEALDEAARAAGWGDYNIALYNDGDAESIRAHAATIMENAALKAENEALRALQEGDGELLTIAWMDGAHRSNTAHREQVAALKVEIERLREAVGILEDGLQEVGDDYPGSSCQEWCQHQIKQARAALKEIEGD